MNFPPDVELMIGKERGDAFLVSDEAFSFEELSKVVKDIVYGEKPSRALKASWDEARKDHGKGLTYVPAVIEGEETLLFPLIVKGKETDKSLVLARIRDVMGSSSDEDASGWVLRGLRERRVTKASSKEQNAEDQPVGDLQPLTDSQAFDLACLAAPEDWGMLDGLWSSWSERRLLKKYLEYTYKRLRFEWKIAVNKNGPKKVLAFNTGLQSSADLGDIIAVCEPAEAPSWRVRGFFVEGDNDGLEQEALKELGELPRPAKYINTISDAVIDLREYDGSLNEKHIFRDNLRRFPLGFLERTLAGSEECLPIIERAKQVANVDDYREEVLDGLRKVIDDDSLDKVKERFREALDRALRRSARNYMLVIPCFYFGQKRMAHMLPICLNEPSVPDLALILDTDGDKLVGKTVYSMRFAYQSARLIMKPAESWVHSAAARFRKGLGSEGVEHLLKGTDPLKQAFEFARLSGLGVMCEVRDGNTIGVYRDDDKPKPDIELPGPGSEREAEYHFVSQLHGSFQFENGRWYYTDEHSTNGTIHIDRDGNPDRVMSGQRIELEHDSELVLANAPSLRFMCMA